MKLTQMYKINRTYQLVAFLGCSILYSYRYDIHIQSHLWQFKSFISGCEIQGERERERERERKRKLCCVHQDDYLPVVKVVVVIVSQWFTEREGV